MVSTPAQLRAASKWRKNNREKFIEIVRISTRKHYYNNIEKESLRKQRSYLFKKECNRLMNILL